MSRESLVLLLGFVVLVMPYLGIPSDWKRIAYTACGALLVVVGYSLRRAIFFRTFGPAAPEPHRHERSDDDHNPPQL